MFEHGPTTPPPHTGLVRSRTYGTQRLTSGYYRWYQGTIDWNMSVCLLLDDTSVESLISSVSISCHCETLYVAEGGFDPPTSGLLACQTNIMTFRIRCEYSIGLFKINGRLNIHWHHSLRATFTLDNDVHFGQLRSLWTTTLTLDNYVHFGQVRSLWTSTLTLDNYVHFGGLRLLWTTTFILEGYVHFGQLDSLWKTTFTLDNYVHFARLSSLWKAKFTLDNCVYLGRLHSLWKTTFTLDNYVHFGQVRSLWTTRFTLDK